MLKVDLAGGVVCRDDQLDEVPEAYIHGERLFIEGQHLPNALRDLDSQWLLPTSSQGHIPKAHVQSSWWAVGVAVVPVLMVGWYPPDSNLRCFSTSYSFK